MSVTVTLVTGDPRSGKKLVGDAVALHINRDLGNSAIAVESMHAELIPPEVLSNVDDLIIISDGARREPWMEPYFKQFGEPLFVIHITRMREES